MAVSSAVLSVVLDVDAGQSLANGACGRYACQQTQLVLGCDPATCVNVLLNNSPVLSSAARIPLPRVAMVFYVHGMNRHGYTWPKVMHNSPKDGG